ncbi:ABC transporter permease [Pollutimonas subterranea]|uniref:ABC transporter permease n=1 Tax=Pollutimonas subterranea TaxID=2045210 RepID=A0A2N4U9W7_9BURK|nr:ABC transporter substrate-binding protein [Pollutimonas subterranea]PLC51810.1 ABC transporter permease [Pollutimonas subterranea]
MKLRSLALALTCALLSNHAGAQSADVARIGVSNDRSGIYSDLGGLGSEVSVRMAVEDFGGSVLGKKIEVIGGDSQNKVDVASTMVRNWFDTQNLVAVVDGGASSTGLAAMHVAAEKKGVALISGGFAGDFSGKQCSPISTQWAPDTYALANAVVGNTVKSGGKSWYFITTDYVFGKTMEETASNFVTAAGGKVQGSTRHPLGSSDFASYLLQAQSSQADVIGLASAGGDLINLIKQAQDFGLTGGNQKLVTFLVFINDVFGMGLDYAQDLSFPTPFYWDANDNTRAWAKRWQEKTGFKRAPSMVQALSYVSTMHYLEAVKAAGTFDSLKVNAKIRELPVRTKLISNARVRPEDGRVIMDMYQVQVKKPSESKSANDVYKILATIPGDKLFVPLADSQCPLVKK